jgi:FAD/FMN-containing dehydrogenase
LTKPLAKDDLEHLKTLAGDNGWIDDVTALGAYLTEWRGLYSGHSDLLLAPDTTKRAAEIIAYCAAKGIGIVPQGGNTGLAGGAIPGLTDGPAEIILSAARLNKIHCIDAANFTLTAGAGCILSDLQEAAAQVERSFPLSLAAEGSCQIGGNLSTNAGGTNVLRFGNTRDLVLGLEVVLPDGRVYANLKALRKDNTGYALQQLFIGAEGTLGFITAVTLKLFPVPRSTATAWLAVASPGNAVAMLGKARQKLGDDLVAFELIPRIAVEMVVDNIPGRRDPLPAPHEWYVLLEIANARDATETESLLTDFLANCMNTNELSDGVVATSEAQRKQFWSVRHDISEAQKLAGASIKHDISVPVSAIPDFLERADKVVNDALPGIRPVAFGHLGDGNLHYNLSPPESISADEFIALWPELNELVHTLAVELNGSFSAEHGIGLLKVDELERLGNPVGLDLMRGIKQLIDPAGIMNPGKVIKNS